MQPSVPNTPARQFRARGSGARRRLLGVALIGLFVSGSALGTAEPARAAPINLTVPSFSPANAVQISGERDPGNSIEITVNGTITACPIPEPPAAAWSCTVALPNGANQLITATERDGGNAVVGLPESANIDVLGAPTLDGAAGFVTSGLVSGTAQPGSTVTALADGSTADGCVSQPVGANGYWSCWLDAGSGNWMVQAQQSNPAIGSGSNSSLSGSLDVVVDKDPPGPPTITSPRTGARITVSRVTYRGTAEPGAVVGLYIDNIPACSVTADGAGNWSCSVRGTTNGQHSVVAIQHDSAGNYGSPSGAIRLVFGPAPSAAPAPPVPPEASPSPTPTPSHPEPPSAPEEPAPQEAAPKGGWGTPTGFGSAIPMPTERIANADWWFAPLFALAFLVLVAIPLRLAATALSGRLSIRRPSFLGRNREPVTSADAEEPQPVSPWLAGAVPLAAAAVFIVLAGGVNDELRYLRLTAAVGSALALLNLVGVAMAGRLSCRALAVTGRIRFLPLLLVAAAVAAVLSRLTGMEPPVFTGVIIGLGIPLAAPVRTAALARMAEVGGTVVLAVAAWLALPMLDSAQGFWASLLGETLAALTLAGLGSALVLVLPIGRLPGAAILRWSRAVWAGTVMIVGIIAAGILLGGPEASFPVLGSLLAAGAVGAIGVAIWSWVRFVEPVQR
ncbi:hypothetical protein BH09ACT3_BH09ACT3_13150 [soil metagenome]